MAEERKSVALEKLVGRFGGDIVSTHSEFGDDTALVRREKIVEVCTFLRDDPDLVIDTVIPVWVGMDWYEREAYDMYGIVFRNHPNLKRILMYDQFVGHPLRKDYPKARRQPTIGPDE